MNINGLLPHEVLREVKSSKEERINSFLFSGKITFITYKNDVTYIGLKISRTAKHKTVVSYPTIVAIGNDAKNIVLNFKRFDRVKISGYCDVSVHKLGERFIHSPKFVLETIEPYAQNSADDTNIIVLKGEIVKRAEIKSSKGKGSVLRIDATKPDNTRKLIPSVYCYGNINDFASSQTVDEMTVGVRCAVYTHTKKRSEMQGFDMFITCEEIVTI